MPTAFVTGGSGFLGRHLIETLVANGWTVRGLARSPAAAAAVRAAGATPVLGSLEDDAALASGLAGADAAFHGAALFTMWAPAHEFERANVEGTRRLLAAARGAGVPRFVQVGASAVVMAERRSMRGVSEDVPLAEPAWAPYIASKARAQRLVLDANGPDLLTSIVLPPLIWGAGMPLLDGVVADVRAGRFAWPAGGRQLMSTAHVDNVAHAALLAAERAAGGRAYFVTDGEDRSFRDVMTALLATRGVQAKGPNVPLGVAWPLARVMEAAWRVLPLLGEPPLTRQALRMVGHDFTLDDARARTELDYRPVVTWDQGIKAMTQAGESAESYVKPEITSIGVASVRLL